MTKPCAIVEGTIEGTCGKKRDKSGRWVVLKPCGKDDLRDNCTSLHRWYILETKSARRWIFFSQTIKPCGKDNLRHNCCRDTSAKPKQKPTQIIQAVLGAKSAAKAEAGGVEQERAGEGARQMF